MKKKVLLIGIPCLLTLLLSFNLSIKDKNLSINTSLTQEAAACNIIPESTADYCWKLEFFPGYYTCEPDGIWSCYV